MREDSLVHQLTDWLVRLEARKDSLSFLEQYPALVEQILTVGQKLEALDGLAPQVIPDSLYASVALLLQVLDECWDLAAGTQVDLQETRDKLALARGYLADGWEAVEVAFEATSDASRGLNL